MTNLRFYLLGTFRTAYQDKTITKFRSAKAQAAIAYLLVERDRVTTREKLLDLLWPGLPAKSARTNLRQVLYQLRNAFPKIGDDGQPLFVSDYSSVQLNPAAVIGSDVADFEQQLAALRQHEHADLLHCQACQHTLQTAIDGYGGTFLDGFHLVDSNTFEDWLIVQQERYERRYLDALDLLGRSQLAKGQYGLAEQSARQQIARDDLRESAYRQLFEALARGGQRNEALAQYERMKEIMQRELGMSPTQKSVQLAEAIANDTMDANEQRPVQSRGYDLLEQVGEGAYGVVHRAYQAHIGREVAVKIIRPELANRPNFIRRFETEAQTIAQLEHPYIVPLYDFWREPDSAFLIMRYLSGGNLANAIAKDGAWGSDDAARLVNQIGSALATAHRKGIIHRDIKPANILLDEDNNAYLSDFSIAQSDADRLPISASSSRFSSPEQLRGEVATVRSDCYAFGLLMSELLIGSAVRPNGNLPEGVSAVLQRATADNPAARFATVDAFAQQLQHALASEVTLPPLVAQIEGNPYKGLRAFQESDSGVFFGRKQLTTQLLAQLTESRFLAVVGPSGSGKSSVVRAGLLPQLRSGVLDGSDNWFITTMIPGTHPLEELEAALLRVAVEPPPSLLEPLQKDERGLIRTLKRILPVNAAAPSRLVLVVDQFEELFTLADEGQRQQFIDNLLAALDTPRSQLQLIVTLRADFYDKPLQIPGLAQYIQANNLVVPPLTAVELEQAIVRPAELAGLRFADGLVTRIVDDVRDQPGILPLLQYALTELFEQHVGQVITHETYGAIGGVTGALGREAERIFGEFSAEQQSQAQQLFLRLITLGEGAEDTRRRVLLREIEALGIDQLAETRKQATENGKQITVNGLDGPSSLILQPFGDARLLSFDYDPITREPTVEVAHEALLREWGTLRQWLDENRADVRSQRMLGVAAKEWQESGQDAAYLLRGSRLEQLQEVAVKSTVALNTGEQAFLEASFAHRDALQANEEARQKRELDQVRQLAETERQRAEEQTYAAGRLRQRAMLLVGALAIAGVLAVLAVNFGRSATANANLAATREAEAQTNADLATTREAEAQTARIEAEQQTRLATAREIATGAITNISEDSELSLLLAMKSLEIAHTWQGEAAIHHALQSVRLRKSVQFADGIPVVVPTADDSHLLFIRPIPPPSSEASVWNITTGEQLYTVPRFGGIESVSPDRTLFAHSLCTNIGSTNQECELNVRSMATGELVEHPITRQFDIDRNVQTRFHVHPSWDYMIHQFADGHIEVIDVEDGSTITLPGHQHPGQTLGFNSDGSLMASSDFEGEAILWDFEATITSGEPVSVANWSLGFDGGFWSTTKSIYEQDGRLFIVSGVAEPITIAVWEIVGDEAILVSEQAGRTNSLNDFDVSADGNLIASVGHAGVVDVADIASGEDILTLTADRLSMHTIDFIDNDTRLMGASQDGTIHYWDASPIRNEVRPLGYVPSPALRLTISPDDRYVAIGGGFTGARLIDLETGEPHIELTSPSGGVRTAPFNPDGTLVAGGGHDGMIRIYDVASGELIREWQAHEPGPADVPDFWSGIWGLNWSPDGKLMASSSQDSVGGTAKLWDAETGTLLYELAQTPEGIYKSIFSPDGSQIALHAGSSGVFVFDTATGEQIWYFDELVFGVGLNYSPDGLKLAASTDLGVFKVWDMESGELAFDTPVLNGFVAEVEFSPDGNYLVVGDDSGMVVWDAHTGEELYELADSGVVTEFEFTSDGRIIGVNFSAGEVSEFTFYLEDALALAWERVTRELTEQECLQYLRSADCQPFFSD